MTDAIWLTMSAAMLVMSAGGLWLSNRSAAPIDRLHQESAKHRGLG